MRMTRYSDVTVKLSSLERHQILICMYPHPHLESLVIRPSCSGTATQNKDSWCSSLGVSARLIQQVKRGADHLCFINT